MIFAPFDAIFQSRENAVVALSKAVGTKTRAAAMLQRLDNLSGMIGQTPLLAIRCRHRGETMTIYAKAEHFNLTGSIKDRMALAVLRDALARGRLNEDSIIAEATSGNTGISLAALARALNLPVRILMPAGMSAERRTLLQSLGAELVLLEAADGGMPGAMRRLEAMAAADPRLFLPRQFANPSNCACHADTTAVEVIGQLEQEGRRADAIVSGIGTGGTIMGLSAGLRRANPQLAAVPVESRDAPIFGADGVAASGAAGHRIQGWANGFMPAVIDPARLAGPVQVSDADSIAMARMLTRELGLAVGLSSGANFLAALEVQRQLGPGATVVTVFADDNKKYLSTGCYDPGQDASAGRQADGTALLDYRALRCSPQQASSALAA